MKCRRRNTDGLQRAGVALQAQEALLVPGEHTRVGGAVRLVTGAAIPQEDRRVLEWKRPALVAVAFEAPDVIRRDPPQLARRQLAVRIVAVGAADGPFLEFVAVGARELGLHGEVTTLAERVRLGTEQRPLSEAMHHVTFGAAKLVAIVRAEQAPAVGELPGVALQASLIHPFCWRRDGVAQRAAKHEDVFGLPRFHMRFAGSMAGLAGAPLPVLAARSFSAAGIYREVWIAPESSSEIFVTEPASLRADVSLRQVLSGRRSAENSQSNKRQKQVGLVRDARCELERQSLMNQSKLPIIYLSKTTARLRTFSSQRWIFFLRSSARQGDRGKFPRCYRGHRKRPAPGGSSEPYDFLTPTADQSGSVIVLGDINFQENLASSVVLVGCCL